MKPWSPAVYPPGLWTDITCTTPNFRPSAPVAAIMQVLDRSVQINWTSPASNGRDIVQYMYEICEGEGCTLGGPGTGAPLHLHGHAINALAAGQRRWLLLPPAAATWSLRPALAQYAAARSDPEAQAIEVVQRAGDAGVS